MKRYLLLLVTVFATICLYAQEVEHLTFKGIPIDGTRIEFIKQMKGNGFRYDSFQEKLYSIYDKGKCTITVFHNPDSYLVYGLEVVYYPKNSKEGGYDYLKDFFTQEYGEPTSIDDLSMCFFESTFGRIYLAKDVTTDNIIYATFIDNKNSEDYNNELLFHALTSSYQETQKQDITKFLGIPIDGSKSEMITQLENKGFVRSYSTSDELKGEFNGYSVRITPVTNNNKVYRIFIEDAYSVSEEQIKIRFNKLCRQFENNGKYTNASFLGDYAIPENEDISYQMTVKNKTYQAAYWQNPTNVNPIALLSIAKRMLNSKSELSEEDIIKSCWAMVADILSKKTVWFKIYEQYGNYKILMFYDNEFNRANGEDL